WITSDVAENLHRNDSASDQRLWTVLANSVSCHPLPLYLRVEDRNSSAHSIEVRVPFLDHRLVELLFRLPDDWRMRGIWNKYVQREAMRCRIPENVRTRRDKMGFPIPDRTWFRGPLYEPIRDLLSSRKTRERGVFHVDKIVAELDRQRHDAAVSPDVFAPVE